MPSIWKAAVEQFEAKRNFVVAVILDVKGSSPRHVGTRFLVKSTGEIVGTIGGGLFEASVRKLAEEAMNKKISHRALFSFKGADAASADMICGGEAEVLVEFVDASNLESAAIFYRLHASVTNGPTYFLTDIPIGVDQHFNGTVGHFVLDAFGSTAGGFPGHEAALKSLPESRLLKPAQMMILPETQRSVFLEWINPSGAAYIFGAGHVGICVAHLAAYVDFEVVVLDDRPELTSESNIPEADRFVVLDSFDRAFNGLDIDADSYIVILTRGHVHDKTVLSQALKTNAGYIGMIGSRRKNDVIFKALLKEGFTGDDLTRVHAPIGLPIGGETPQEIAVSILAEMIQVRNKKGRPRRSGCPET